MWYCLKISLNFLQYLNIYNAIILYNQQKCLNFFYFICPFLISQHIEACLGRDVDFLGDPCSPDCFYTCKSTDGDDSPLASQVNGDQSFTAERRCCAECLLWSQMELTCLPNLVTPECQMNNATNNVTSLW